MRKVIFSLLAIIGLGFAANKVTAQTAPLKIGYFDIDQMVQAMPEYKTAIQPKVEAFQKDSLGTAKDNLDTLFSNAQETYKNDSLAKKSASILSYDRQKLQELYMKEVNWQQIQQNETQRKFYEIAKPTYDKVAASYKKVLAANKITLVLNPGAIEGMGTDPKSITNLFELVAKDLGVKLDNGEGDTQQAPAGVGK